MIVKTIQFVKRQPTNVKFLVILLLVACSEPVPPSTFTPESTPLPPATVTLSPTHTPPPAAPVTPPPLATASSSSTVAPEITTWIQANAIPFHVVELQSDDDFADLMPLKEIIGDARIIGLGEGTHGTHEFFAFKHRLIAFFVQEMGFNLIAFENNWGQSNLVNDYIHGGQGAPEKLMANFGYWVWETEEVFDMVEWMRRYNQNLNGASSLSFLGFDMVPPALSARSVVIYLEQVDPQAAEEASDAYACLTAGYQYGQLTSADQDTCRFQLQTTHDLLIAHQDSYIKQTSPEAFNKTLQDARVLLQAEAYLRNGSDRVRDQGMADNITWFLEQAGPEAKIIVWAHNGHIRKQPGWVGDYLAQQHGAEYVNLGFVFYSGTFNARSAARGGAISRHEADVPPLADSYESILHNSAVPRFFLDLRPAEKLDPAASWLREPHPYREIGVIYDPDHPEDYYKTAALASQFDLIVYMEETTASRLLDTDAQTLPQP